MDIYIGCDDSGFKMKQEIIRYLSEHNYNYFDCGSGQEPSRYPYYAAKVASAVSSGKASRGILICGSGIGMSIAANKVRGIRAAAVSDCFTAQATREHNDSNILCLGERTVGPGLAMRIVDTWLNASFQGGRHQVRLDMISELEQN